MTTILKTEMHVHATLEVNGKIIAKQYSPAIEVAPWLIREALTHDFGKGSGFNRMQMTVSRTEITTNKETDSMIEQVMANAARDGLLNQVNDWENQPSDAHPELKNQDLLDLNADPTWTQMIELQQSLIHETGRFTANERTMIQVNWQNKFGRSEIHRTVLKRIFPSAVLMKQLGES